MINLADRKRTRVIRRHVGLWNRPIESSRSPAATRPHAPRPSCGAVINPSIRQENYYGQRTQKGRAENCRLAAGGPPASAGGLQIITAFQSQLLRQSRRKPFSASAADQQPTRFDLDG